MIKRVSNARELDMSQPEPRPVKYLGILGIVQKVMIGCMVVGFITLFLRGEVTSVIGLIAAALCGLINVVYLPFATFRLSRIAARLGGGTSWLGTILATIFSFTNVTLTGVALAICALYIGKDLEKFQAQFPNSAPWTPAEGQARIALLTNATNEVFISTAIGTVLTGLIYGGIVYYLSRPAAKKGAPGAMRRAVLSGVIVAFAQPLLAFTSPDFCAWAILLGGINLVLCRAYSQIQEDMKRFLAPPQAAAGEAATGATADPQSA